MKLYDIIFERLYALFGKGASINPEHKKLDGAVLTSLILSILVFFNILSITLIFCKKFSVELPINFMYGLFGITIIIIINLLYFLWKKKYIKLKSEISQISIRKRNKYSILTFLYALVSIGLFFYLL